MRLAAVDPEEAAEAAEAGGDYALLARMGAGLFALQQCALVLGHLWFVGDLGVRKRILLLLHQQARLARGPRRAPWRAAGRLAPRAPDAVTAGAGRACGGYALCACSWCPAIEA